MLGPRPAPFAIRFSCAVLDSVRMDLTVHRKKEGQVLPGYGVFEVRVEGLDVVVGSGCAMS